MINAPTELAVGRKLLATVESRLRRQEDILLQTKQPDHEAYTDTFARVSELRLTVSELEQLLREAERST